MAGHPLDAAQVEQKANHAIGEDRHRQDR